MTRQAGATLNLRIVAGAERAEGATLAVTCPAARGRLAIGRDPACDWPLPDRSLALSARHCELVNQGDHWLLRDLSTNGTFVNEQQRRVEADHRLRDGDRISAGPYVFQVEFGVQAAAGEALTELVAKVPDAPASAVEDTAPLPGSAVPRGADPAAIAIDDLILPESSSLDLTRIRPASRDPKREAAAPMPVGAAPVAPASAAAGAAAQPVELLAALARGMGLAEQAFAGDAAAQAVESAGRIARVAVAGLRDLLRSQARASRRLGSHGVASLQAVSPLRLAVSTDDAIAMLTAMPPETAAGVVASACADIGSHQARMAASYRAAARSLADAMAPAAIADALAGPDDSAHHARLWQLYRQLWARMGLTGADAPWQEGFLEAALAHLAAAYDVTSPADDATGAP